MPGNFKKEDLRITKTIRALRAALVTLLRLNSFSRITVNNLCEEALCSRATFYMHFRDKYDLMECVLTGLHDDMVDDPDRYFDEPNVSQLIVDNSRIIKNTMENADGELLELLHQFMTSVLKVYIQNKSDEGKGLSLHSTDYIVLSNFFSGGMVNLLQRQAGNRFPPDIRVISKFLFGMLAYTAEWSAKR